MIEVAFVTVRYTCIIWLVQLDLTNSLVVFFMQHTPLEKLDKKHFAKGAHGLEKIGVAAVPLEGNLKEIALMETKMKKLCELLDEVSK